MNINNPKHFLNTTDLSEECNFQTNRQNENVQISSTNWVSRDMHLLFTTRLHTFKQEVEINGDCVLLV